MIEKIGRPAMKLNCKVGDRIWIDGEPFFVYETYENGNVLVASINCYSEDDPRLKWAQELSSTENHDIIVESMDKFYEKLTMDAMTQLRYTLSLRDDYLKDRLISKTESGSTLYLDTLNGTWAVQNRIKK